MQSLIPVNTAPTNNTVASRPMLFRERYLAAQSLAYRFVDVSGKPSPSGGVLCSGQSVWLEAVIQRNRLPSSIRAFVESVGLVVVDPRWLKKGDGPLPL